jgi:hypothetical protein
MSFFCPYRIKGDPLLILTLMHVPVLFHSKLMRDSEVTLEIVVMNSGSLAGELEKRIAPSRAGSVGRNPERRNPTRVRQLRLCAVSRTI